MNGSVPVMTDSAGRLSFPYLRMPDLPRIRLLLPRTLTVSLTICPGCHLTRRSRSSIDEMEFRSAPSSLGGVIQYGINNMNELGLKESDLRALIDQISSAFENVKPSPLCHDILTQEAFESAFMGNELQNTLRHLYDYNEDENHYLTPFLMRAYLNHYGEDELIDDEISNYLFWFGHFNDEDDFIRNRYLSFYGMFDTDQRKSICAFLKFLLKYKIDGNFISQEVVDYWC